MGGSGYEHWNSAVDGRDAVNATGAGDALHGGERDGADQVPPEPDAWRNRREREGKSMRLKLGQCGCTKTGRKYCRTGKGYRFMSGKCRS